MKKLIFAIVLLAIVVIGCNVQTIENNIPLINKEIINTTQEITNNSSWYRPIPGISWQ
jgi:hypothetical protein